MVPEDSTRGAELFCDPRLQRRENPEQGRRLPDFRENAEKFLGALERVAKANAQRAVDAKAVQVKLTEEENYIRRMAADPSQMRKSDWTNFTADEAAKHSQEIFRRVQFSQG